MAKKNGERTKQIIQIGRELGYPRYGKIVHSLVGDPARGIQRVPEFQAAVDKLDGKPQAPRRAANRKDRARISVWVPEALRRKFNSSKEYRGYVTDHDYVAWLILSDAARIEEEKGIAARPNGVGLTRKRSDGQAGGISPQGGTERSAPGSDEKAAAPADTENDGKPNKPMASITAGKENVK